MTKYSIIQNLRILFSWLAVCMLASVAAAETVKLRAELQSSSVILGGVIGSSSVNSGYADLLLTWDGSDPVSAEVGYEIYVDADLDGLQTPELNDDVTAIHLHNVDMCMAAACQPGDTAGTMHVLNIYGVPRQDDADMVFSVVDGTVSGLWDSADANALTPAPSQAPSDSLTRMLDGELFVMVHTREFPSGAFGGFANVVPEPVSANMWVLGALLVTQTMRRRRVAR